MASKNFGLDTVGFDANGVHSGGEVGVAVLDSLMDSTRLVALWEISGFSVTDDPGGVDEAAKTVSLSLSREDAPRGYAECDTGAGDALLEQARIELAEFDERPPTPAAPAGGKAKASKGTGRTPIVKGEPRPYKNRQSR